MFGVLRLYGETAALAARRSVKAWPVAFSLVLYAAIMWGTGLVAAPLGGMIAGVIIGLVSAACLSSYLYLISQAVSGNTLRVADLKKSFGARFWDVMSVLFIFWIFFSFVLPMFMRGAGENAPMVMMLIGVAMAALFNPVPELLYQGSSRSLQLLIDSVRFVSRHGIEWFAPNILFALALLAPVGLLRGPPGQVIVTLAALFRPDHAGLGLIALLLAAPWPFKLAMLLFLHWVMVFRGILWKELTSGGARQRALRDVWRR